MGIRAIALLLAALFALGALGCGGDDDDDGGATGAEGSKPVVTIGTKNFPEQFVLGELYRQALERRGFRIDLKRDIGATEIIHRALERGTLDFYPEYIGVLNSEVAGETERLASADDVYEGAKRFEERSGFTLLERTPFQNKDAIAVTPEFARRHDLRELGDLKDAGSVSLAGPPEFRTRFEGFVGLQEVYGIDNIDFTPLQIGEQYRALDSGSVEAADVFTTDGELARKEYVVLEDPENLFGFQHVAPVVSEDVLREQGPDFARTVNAVSAKLTTDAMQRMNAAVTLGRQAPETVARDFLRQQRLI
jgi:osmoprotectant transport system substrate-binding protein